MTVKEFLDSLPEEKREDMADFFYSRVPCRYGLRNTASQDTQPPSRVSSILHPLVQATIQRV
jgi:hypothetical protein